MNSTSGLLLGRDEKGEQLRLDPKALTTHGFVLGMTGAGKTGMCVVMVEELLRAGVPVIAVDSKGDLSTLLLGIDPKDASSLQKWASDPAKASKALQAGEVASGLSSEQARAFRASYEPRLYTPGAPIGLTLDLIGNLAPPSSSAPEDISQAADAAVQSLLSLLGIDADPVSSREYLFLVALLTSMWSQGCTPTLADLVRAVMAPDFDTLGALPLEEFYPAKQRKTLMVQLNGLLASPRFAAWRQGEALDPGILFRGPTGKPRLSIYSVAHLSDEERIFAVAQLLERTQSWMRKEGGDGALRGVIFIDEIFGYFPPTANPPTKAPLLALLKQARAFGVSIILATQNPIDLDYRGLANIGTWLIGRLQTEQDKDRIRDTLLASAANTGITSEELDALISKLAPRKFLLHSIHRPKPTVISSRECMTLLHGPFSANQLRELSAPMREPAASTSLPSGISKADDLNISSSTNISSNISKQNGPAFLDAAWKPQFEVTSGVGVPYLVVSFKVGKNVHTFAYSLAGTSRPEDVISQPSLGISSVRLQEQVPARLRLSGLPQWIYATTPSNMRELLGSMLADKYDLNTGDVNIQRSNLVWMTP